MNATVRFPGLLLAALEFVLAYGSYVAVFYLETEASAELLLWYEGYWIAIGFVALVIVLAMYLQGLYAQLRIRSRVELALQVTTTAGVAFLSQALVHYGHTNASLPMPVMLRGSVLAFLLLFCNRLLYFRVAARGFGLEPVLIMGLTPTTRAIAARLGKRPGHGMKVAGFITDQLPAGAEVEGAAVLGPIEAVAEICQKIRPDRLVADLRDERLKIPAELARKILRGGIVLEHAHELYEALFLRAADVPRDPEALIFRNEISPSPRAIAIQSIYNNIAGLILLVLAAPAIAVTAVLLRMTGRGPIWEQQATQGWDGVPFGLFQFRCGPGVVGRWVTRLRLDRLPRLLNLLRGEIALVGPRPIPMDTANEILEQIPAYRYHFAIKPGLVGWAQIHVPAASSQEEMMRELQYDVYYVKHMSVVLDCYVLWDAWKSLFSRALGIR